MTNIIYETSKHNFNNFSNYLDKFSLEHHNLPEIFINREKFSVSGSKPKISFQIAENNMSGDVFRTIFDVKIDYVILGTNTSSSQQEEYHVYTLQMIYIALTNIENSATLTDIEKKKILLVDIPYLVFPFVRQAIYNITEQTKSTPIQLNPINFLKLFYDENKRNDE